MQALRDLLLQDTISVAKNLLGWELKLKQKNDWIGGVITETEAYTQNDPACHAYLGKKTKRNSAMFEAAGHLYIYMIYGRYHCLNIVTNINGIGEAVLIRQLTPTIGLNQLFKNRHPIQKKEHLLNGPSKLMLGLNISPALNGMSLFENNCPIQLSPPKKQSIFKSLPRVGISKAKDKKWRFLTHNQHIPSSVEKNLK